MTRGEMMRRMTAREYDEWLVFMQLVPAVGERGAYYRAGELVATVQNLTLKEGATVRTPLDVFPFLDDSPVLDEEEAEEELREQAIKPDEMAAWLEAAFPNAARAS